MELVFFPLQQTSSQMVQLVAVLIAFMCTGAFWPCLFNHVVRKPKRRRISSSREKASH